MSEETVDIHIRINRDNARMLESLMELGNYTSKSAYIEEMINAIEDIFSSYYTHHRLSQEAKNDSEKLIMYAMFIQYLLSPLRRLGWVAYRDYRDSKKPMIPSAPEK
jgi:Arc/MetJ-type ribon-helix-helix transcriptional regulator